MGLRGGVISESPPCPGTGEQRGRPQVEGRPPARRVLHPEVVKQVWAQFGRAEMDLFANRRNSHCALWFSLALRDDPPFGVDAFAHEPWPRKLLYAFPPLRLILSLLGRVRRERLSVILVAPDRVGAPWYSEMTQMKVGQPWAIPQFWGAMSQGAGAIGRYPLWAVLSRLGS